ncbi:unnamed protein product [Cuscuta epithymum]|uniref:Uncharacterized protein n=1 Tax=Cuscuta epithymum TaxID=186058 RepID=A0AAV0C9N5_9ASTE|nr:unnamed protein product [Cuscuta epithymum]
MASRFARRQTSRVFGHLLSSSLPHLCTRNGVSGKKRFSPVLTQFVVSSLFTHRKTQFPRFLYSDLEPNLVSSPYPTLPEARNPSGIYQKFILKPKRSDLRGLSLLTNGQRAVFSSSSEQAELPSGGGGKSQRGRELKRREICEPSFDRNESTQAYETRDEYFETMKEFALCLGMTFCVCLIPLILIALLLYIVRISVEPMLHEHTSNIRSSGLFGVDNEDEFEGSRNLS